MTPQRRDASRDTGEEHGDTVWLTADQLADLFGRDKSSISRHLKNVFSEQELQQDSVVAEFATTAGDGKTYVVSHYNLDVVISVGYRVRSAEGVRFRQWATGILRDYLIAGAAINDRRLEELGSVVRILERAENELVAGVGEVVSAYLPGLRSLRDYDEGRIESPVGDTPTWVLGHAEARTVIDDVATQFPQDVLLGAERGDQLRAIVGLIYQTFDGRDLYPSVQTKAANLLYLTIKDHPLVDGNKRCAAALFVHFLARNGTLHSGDGVARVSNNALAAITLMVAMSDPREKDLMVALVTSMLS